ncbi:hypothetical protein MN608_06091 [Microdochium nivale]|nr:hypothetical protein MN608_06091 [Microdochium nivale]
MSLKAASPPSYLLRLNGDYTPVFSDSANQQQVHCLARALITHDPADRFCDPETTRHEAVVPSTEYRNVRAPKHAPRGRAVCYAVVQEPGTSKQVPARPHDLAHTD